jgi:hypothetical protein
LTTLVDVLSAVHTALSEANIPHAIGGAIALGYCIEEARGTIDLDVNVFLPKSRCDAVFDALPKEIAIDPSDRETVMSRAQVRLYWDDTAVDLFFNDHPFHQSVSARVREVPFADTSIPVLDCTDLLVFKAMFSRPKDWVDIAEMIKAKSIDLVEASRWLGSLLGTDSVGYRRFVHLAEHDGADEAFVDDLFGR